MYIMESEFSIQSPQLYSTFCVILFAVIASLKT